MMNDLDKFYEQNDMLDSLEQRYGPDKVEPLKQEFRQLNPKWKEMLKLRDLNNRKDQLEFEQRPWGIPANKTMIA